MQPPEIIAIPDRTLLGMRIRTTLAANQTFALWQGFKREAGKISNRKGTDYYSVQQFDAGSLAHFTPTTPFDKWAAVEVAGAGAIPDGMETYLLPGGLYAVFTHRGPAQEFQRTMDYIFGVWLPASGYTLDERPHFEIMGASYRPDDPQAEESVWIPLRTTDS